MNKEFYRQCKFITITRGDTIGDLAFKYNTTVDAIIKANPSIDVFNLSVGQQLCIPIDEIESLICPIGSIPYQVKEGETLSSIATKFLTTDEQLLKINPELNPNNLQVGQVICIKEVTLDPINCPSMNIYVVKKGDTFVSIANKFGISVKELISVNPTVDPNNLTIDTVICLPITPTPYIIVINTKDKILDLYYLGEYKKSYPVAVGKPKTPTPLGQFTVYNKQVNPGGPFGTRWMGLSKPSYGIHGTNTPKSIGTAASNGCIRMFNNDVEELFSIISINTPVIILL